MTNHSLGAMLQDPRPRIGMWIASGSPMIAEICAGSALDWVLIDCEHAPNDLRSVLAQLHAISAYPVASVVRPPTGDPVVIKQLLDIGVVDLLIPMVETAEQAAELIEATQYPPRGVRGVGSALARASGWNRKPSYLETADAGISLYVQVESPVGLANLDEIIAVDGLAGVFIGPADLAASLGHLGDPGHSDVVAAVDAAVTAVAATGIPVGANSFDPARGRRLLDLGCRFLLVGADVTLVATGSDSLARTYTNVLDGDAASRGPRRN